MNRNYAARPIIKRRNRKERQDRVEKPEKINKVEKKDIEEKKEKKITKVDKIVVKPSKELKKTNSLDKIRIKENPMKNLHSEMRISKKPKANLRLNKIEEFKNYVNSKPVNDLNINQYAQNYSKATENQENTQLFKAFNEDSANEIYSTFTKGKYRKTKNRKLDLLTKK